MSAGQGAPIARILAAAFMRSVAIGFVAIVLGLSLTRRGLSPALIGGVVSAGLAGSALASALAAFSHRLGRKRFLVGQALLAAACGMLLPFATSPVWLLGLAFGGMVNGMGRDRGAALVIESALIPEFVSSTRRTWAFAWYSLVQDAGHAVGAGLAGLPALLAYAGLAPAVRDQAAYGLYSALMLGTALLYAGLPAESPGSRAAAPARMDRTTLRRLSGLASLFAMDAVGGGFLTAALIAYFLATRFGVGAATIALLYLAARIANAGSHMAAAWLGRRFGLINTMVFTHIPSSLLLVGVALAPNFPVAAVCFLLRESLVEMDVPTRQSYVMAVVRPEDRTTAASVTSLVRLGGWAVGPALAGWAMARWALAGPLIIGAGIKIGYDVLLYFGFRRVHPGEESERSSRSDTVRT